MLNERVSNNYRDTNPVTLNLSRKTTEPIDGVQEEDEDEDEEEEEEDNDDQSVIINSDILLSSDTEPKVKTPTLEAQKLSRSNVIQTSPKHKVSKSKRSNSTNRIHFRNWTVASVIPSPEKLGINNKQLVESLRLSITEHHEKNSNRSNQSDYSSLNATIGITPPQTTPRRQYGNYHSDEDMPDMEITDNDGDVDVDKNDNNQRNINLIKLGGPKDGTSNSTSTTNTNTRMSDEHSVGTMDSKQELMINENGERKGSSPSSQNNINRHYKLNKSKTEILSTTNTMTLSPSPFTTPLRSKNGCNNNGKSQHMSANSRKLHDLLNATYTTKNGKTDYSSIGTVLGTSSKPKKLLMPSINPHIGRGHSVDLTNGLVERTLSDRQKEMKKLSVLQAIFGTNKDKEGRETKKLTRDKKERKHIRVGSAKSVKSDSAGLTRTSIISYDRSERNSLFGSGKEKSRESIKFSSRINYDIVRNSIDFDLDKDITEIVNPLTQDFIPVPESFANVPITDAAKHIFKQFIDDGAPYMINICSETRFKLKQLFRDATFTTMSNLSKIFLFDSSFHEIYITIASDSFLRFKTSEKFLKWLKEGHLKHIPDAYHQKEDSQWSFNASFVDFNSSLYERRKDNDRLSNNLGISPIVPTMGNARRSMQLRALPSGQAVERFS